MAEGARLESVYTATYRGFESLSLRQFTALELLDEIDILTVPRRRIDNEFICSGSNLT